MRKYPTYKPSGVEWLGEVPLDWELWKVSRLYKKIGSGTTPKAGNPEFYENGTIPWVNTGDLNDGYISDCSNYITQKAFDEHSALKINDAGTLLVAMYGATIGKIAITKFAACTNQACCSLAESKLIDTKFAFYWFIANKENVVNLSYGGGQPNISQDIIRGLKIPICKIEDQHSIVRFLDYKTAQIDSFITNRQKQIELLKEQRSSIIDKAILHGLNRTDEVYKFDNIFVKQLPVNWKLSSVRREIMAQNFEQQDGNHGELHPVASDYVDEGIPFVLASDVNNFEVDLIRCKKIPKRIAEKLRIGFSKTGDILLTHKGTVGRVGICDTKEYPYIILTPQVTYYRIKRDYLPKYIFWQFQSNVFTEQLKLLSGGGSTRDYIGLVAQRDLRIIKPPISEQIEIVEYLDNETKRLDNLISKYQKQIELMQEYRTSLISQAVTGKIDVRDWKPKIKEYSIEKPDNLLVAEE
ncbi:MAG: restriction endonuclease subunit S [Paludibacter sp.]|nr:restriction endonuclease subunit S [Paludibacter sp.]